MNVLEKKIILVLIFNFIFRIGFSATYVVDNTSDTDNLLGYTTSDGTNSLRKCIRLADANSGADVINFNISGTGPYVISPVSTLPSLTDNAGVTIDGYSQSGSTANTNLTGTMNSTLMIILNGGNFSQALNLTSTNNIIKGLVIPNNWGDGTSATACINISANNNKILGCYIGTNQNGISVSTGLNLYGINVSSAAASGNTIGDGTAIGRNIISGNKEQGISISGFGTIIKGNLIGVGSDGDAIAGALQRIGIDIGGNGSNIIGGTSTGEGNVISGNTDGGTSGLGIELESGGSNVIKGNIIGPQADGITIITSNEQANGIDQSTFDIGLNTIGGSATGAGNIVSGNVYNGIYLNEGHNLIQGNYIGTSSSGSMITGSTQYWGINIFQGSNNTIGGCGSGQANLIAFNSNYGINLQGSGFVNTGDMNLVSRNLIYSNGTKAIELNYSLGVNNYRNNGKAIPTIGTITTTSVNGTNASTSGVGDSVEVFKNISGNCQDAMIYLGTTKANGAGSWTLSGIAINSGENILVSTRTVSNNNTSEFACATAVLPIELLTFTAKNTNNGSVLLEWTTATEKNNDHFTIERSNQWSVISDLWETIGTVKGVGNSNAIQHYQLSDYQLPISDDQFYYRLKQTDYDDNFTYSKIISLTIEALNKLTINTYPNPVKTILQIEFPNEQYIKSTLSVTDVLGNTLSQIQPSATNTNNNFEFNLSGLDKGIYFLKINSLDSQKSIPFIKE